jgi:hypothetical protein
MELVPETLYSNELTRLCAREDYIELNFIFDEIKYLIFTFSRDYFVIAIHVLIF